MRWRLGLTLLLAATMTAGCTDSPVGPTDRAALAVAEARWAERGFTDYEFTYAELADLLPPFTVRITVRGGAVTSVEQLSGDPLTVAQRSWPRIEDLFADLHRDARRRTTFDPALGYPMHVEFPRPKGVVDGYFSYTVNDVRSADAPAE